MKKLIIIAVGLFILQKWDAINAYFNPQPDYADVHEEEVILYATSWCGYCAKARRFLEDRGIDYYEYDIEKSDEGREQYDSLGIRGVPVLLVNGTLVRGYNPNRILELLEWDG